MTAMPGRRPCCSARSFTRSAYSPRSFRATPLPSMIPAVKCRSSRSNRSVPVVIGLVRAFLADADVLRLLFRELGELNVQGLQPQQRDLLVQVLGQHVDTDRVLALVGEKFDLRQHL